MEPTVPESRQYRVRDIMTRDVIKVSPDASVGAIARIMSESRVSGVPVVDDEGRVLGIITELDMVIRNTRFKLPAFFTLLNATIYLETPSHIDERLHHILGTTAREIMSAPPVVIGADASIEELAELMVDRRVNPVPVIENGRVAGIVSRSDIIRSMAASDSESA